MEGHKVTFKCTGFFRMESGREAFQADISENNVVVGDNVTLCSALIGNKCTAVIGKVVDKFYCVPDLDGGISSYELEDPLIASYEGTQMACPYVHKSKPHRAGHDKTVKEDD